MRELENLKDLYLEEIKKINKKGELTPADAEAAKKALEAIEKINEICCDEDEMCDEYSERGYSSRRTMDRSYGGRMYSNGRMPEMHHPYYNDDGYDYRYSERRGRSSVTGRYISRHDGPAVDKMIRKLETMKQEAPDHETMMAIDNVINKLEDY